MPKIINIGAGAGSPGGGLSFTAAQTTAGAVDVLGETAAGAFVNGAGATVLTKSGPATTFPGALNSGTDFSIGTNAGYWQWATGNVWIPGSASFSFTTNSAATSASTRDVFLYRGGPGILDQRNGTAAQRFRVFNTGDSTNGEWFDIDWQTNTNTVRVGTRAAGSGAVRNLEIVSALALTFGAGGAAGGIVLDAPGTSRFYPSSDNVMDLGVSSRRWLNLWVSNALKFGSTSSEPMLKRSGTSMQARLADDSGFANFQASNLIASGTVRVIPVPVGSLPSASASGAGAEATVNDATSPAWGATVAGGGAVTVGVRSNGTNWIVF